MSEQERQEGVRANTRDVKRRCEVDSHETERHTDPTKDGRKHKQKLNVLRSLMSLQFLSTVPLGPELTRISVYVGAFLCVYPPLKHWAVHNLSDSCQLCTPIYSASQILSQQRPQPAGMTATETV